MEKLSCDKNLLQNLEGTDDPNHVEIDEDDEEITEEVIEESAHETDSEIEAVDEEESVTLNHDKYYFTGKDGTTKWNKIAPKPTKTLIKDIVIHMPGNKSSSKNIKTPLESFHKIFDVEMVNLIVEYTNIKISMKLENRQKLETYEKITDFQEMLALFGLLFLAGVFKSSKLSLDDLWNIIHGPPIFRSTMSQRRFKFLLANITFDDIHTRDIRQIGNKLALISELWELFIKNCQNSYTISEYATVDEMLCPFRGRCSFVQYLPSKPAKYGIKVFAICCAKTFYFLNGEIYAGKKGDKRASNISHDVVISLSTPIHNTGRNITTDNWYTSISLAQSLAAKNLTLVGTLKKNKREIPPQFLSAKSRAVYSTLEGFNSSGKLVSYVPQKNKSVIIFSSFHNKKSMIYEEEKNKPEEILFYNMTKGGIDTLDKLCTTYSVQRPTRRWTMAIFYLILDICTVNSLVLLRNASPDYFKNKNSARRLFIRELGESLTKFEINRRSMIQTLNSNVKKSISYCIPEASTSQNIEVEQTSEKNEKKENVVIYAPEGKIAKPLLFAVTVNFRVAKTIQILSV